MYVVCEHSALKATNHSESNELLNLLRAVYFVAFQLKSESLRLVRDSLYLVCDSLYLVLPFYLRVMCTSSLILDIARII